MKDKCIVKGCDRPISVKKHQLCHAHTMRWYRNGDIGKGKIPKRKKHKPFVLTYKG